MNLFTHGILLAASLALGEQPPEEFAGCWQDLSDPTRYVEVASGRVHLLTNGELEITRATYDLDTVTLHSWGHHQRWELTLDDAVLTIKIASNERHYRTACTRPSEIEYQPLVLGKAAIAPDRLASLKSELASRRDKDQAVRQGTPELSKMEPVDQDNTAWLKTLVQELGWIGVPRFGSEAASAAFLIVQHSGDVPLMLAALPEIERDVKQHGLDAQNYALLYDRLQIHLGHKQRYGSQLGTNEKGQHVVIALEDREHVEELRKAIGLFPLKQYLDLFKRGGASEVVFEDDESE